MKICMFCGPTAARITGEHAWPDWILRLLRAKYPTTEEFAGVRQISGQPGQIWDNPSFEIKVNDVCKTCNEGWMSELEDCAKPLLRELIVDKSATAEWRDLDQLTLAVWTIKTAMVFEHTVSRSPFFTPEERLAFRDQYEEPPADVWVWAAAYDGSSPLLFQGRHLKLRRNGKHVGNAYVATSVAGHIAFQVVGRRWFEPRDASSFAPRESGRWRRTTVRIWPPAGRVCSWPPGSPLTDGLLESFSRRWDDRLRVVR